MKELGVHEFTSGSDKGTAIASSSPTHLPSPRCCSPALQALQLLQLNTYTHLLHHIRAALAPAASARMALARKLVTMEVKRARLLLKDEVEPGLYGAAAVADDVVPPPCCARRRRLPRRSCTDMGLTFF
ncbi:hypothetical protein ACP4OV_016919 [Aristida adscensionis]